MIATAVFSNAFEAAVQLPPDIGVPPSRDALTVEVFLSTSVRIPASLPLVTNVSADWRSLASAS
ncbi:MAG: hypothetical protein JW395_2146 [Nitrospira sp.]|nr:hypothetical protein [Nitrospira sp.]